MEEIKIKTDFIKLDSLLKLAGACSTGAEAKFHIKSGEVKVNGLVEIRRGKKIRSSDEVEFNGNKYKVLINIGDVH